MRPAVPGPVGAAGLRSTDRGAVGPARGPVSVGCFPISGPFPLHSLPAGRAAVDELQSLLTVPARIVRDPCLLTLKRCIPLDYAPLLPLLGTDVDILVLCPAALREPVAHEVGVEAGGLAGAAEVGRVGAGRAAGAGGGAGADAVVGVTASSAPSLFVFK